MHVTLAPFIGNVTCDQDMTLD